VIGCLLWNDRGLESLGHPDVVIAVLLIVGVSCIPLLRQAIFTTAERNGPPKTRRWVTRVPWVGLLLIWNGIGGLVVLSGILSIILSVQFSIRLFDPWDGAPPNWCIAVLSWLWFWLWVLPMPFTTLGVVIFLWRSRQDFVSRMLLLYCLVVFALWSYLIMALIPWL
jgi:hypothetical protein